MTLKSARRGRIYTVQKIDIDDTKLEAFLLTLGLFRGEKIYVVCRVRGGMIIAIRGGKYCIDSRLAQAIII